MFYANNAEPLQGCASIIVAEYKKKEFPSKNEKTDYTSQILDLSSVYCIHIE